MNTANNPQKDQDAQEKPANGQAGGGGDEQGAPGGAGTGFVTGVDHYAQTGTAGGAAGTGTGTDTIAGPGTGGVGSTGDLSGPGEVDTLRDLDGDVPLPAGLDEHAPIPGRDAADAGAGDSRP